MKITQATMKRNSSGRPEFRNTGQHFIEVIDSTANVTHAVKEHWGKVVSSDGLKKRTVLALKVISSS